jgi:mannose-6-phosphate isomerase-like protein (cupin superfamily)
MRRSRHVSYPNPRYSGEDGQVSAKLRPSDQPYDLEIGNGGTQVHYLATGASASGGFGLYRWDFTGPRSGPDPHFHKTVSESFYMLSGTIQLYDGRGWADAKPGDFLFVPEGGIHGFRNESGQPASMLLLFAPGAPREAYFESLAEWAVTGKQPSGEERAEFMLRHDTYWL